MLLFPRSWRLQACAFLATVIAFAQVPASATYPSVVSEIAQLPKPRPDALPVTDPNVIFAIHSSSNIDTVVYALVGPPTSTSLSVQAYWRRNSRKNGVREDLSFLERQLAYGVSTTETIPGVEIEMRVNGYPERPITVRLDADKRIRALVDIGGRKAEIAFVYVTIDDSRTISRAVAVDLYARDVLTKKILLERFTLISP